jgi:hypothetical protein
MIRNEIEEYPYTGTITRVIEGDGRSADTAEVIYDGAMDCHMVSEEQGTMLQTSSYIISIPLLESDNGVYIVPERGDKISLERYGQPLNFVVDNATPSQIGGVSIYATRNSW